MFSFLSKLWDSIKNLLSKIWDILKVIIAVALILAAIYFLWVGAYLYAAICFAGAYLVDEETASKVVDGVTSMVSDVGSAVVEVAGTLANSVASSLLSGPLGWVLLLGAGMFLLKGSGNSDKGTVLVEEDDTEPRPSLIERTQTNGN